MRITLVMLSEGWGGAERLFIELASGLVNDGHDVQVICRPGFDRGVTLRRLPGLEYRTISALGNWDFFSCYQMQRLIAEFRPQVIHTHLIRATVMAGRAGKKLGIPTVTTTHNQIKAKYFGKIDYFTTITRQLQDYLIDQGVPAQRISHIPNFSLFTPAREVQLPPERPPVFLSLGRFVPKKGYSVLLQAFAQFLAIHGPARLLLGGGGQEEKRLKHLAVELGLADSIEFCGWIEDTEAFFGRGDVFVLPSLDEPFGIVLLEAMAKGLPIVTTRTAGPLDLLEDETAYFVAVGDAADLCRGMHEAARCRENRTTKARHALDRYVKNYTRAAVLPQFVAFYQHIIQANRVEG